MTIRDDAPRILEALSSIEGLAVVSAWPREEMPGPAALVTLASETAADRRDDRAYLTALEYYVRVFAAKAEGMRQMCAAVNEAMEALGYERVMRWEEPGGGLRQTVLRYRTYLG